MAAPSSSARASGVALRSVLIITARAKSPSDEGAVSCTQTEPPPADSPATVTCAGSSPKAATFSCTHLRAACWSMRP